MAFMLLSIFVNKEAVRTCASKRYITIGIEIIKILFVRIYYKKWSINCFVMVENI